MDRKIAFHGLPLVPRVSAKRVVITRGGLVTVAAQFGEDTQIVLDLNVDLVPFGYRGSGAEEQRFGAAVFAAQHAQNCELVPRNGHHFAATPRRRCRCTLS